VRQRESLFLDQEIIPIRNELGSERLAASNERIGAVISDYYPKISLSGGIGLDSTNGGHSVNGKAFQPVGTGTLRWGGFSILERSQLRSRSRAAPTLKCLPSIGRQP
jgi:hypothetical protein